MKAFGKLGTSLVVLTLAAACGGKPTPTMNAERANSIVGGTPVGAESPIAKSTVGLFRSGRFVCSASILNDHVIVTAAHCVTSFLPSGRWGRTASPTELSVGFGRDLRLGSTYATRPATAVYVHQRWFEFDPSEYSEFGWGDVAIVHFSGGIAEGYQPATMLPNGTPFQNGAAMVLAGYGVQNPRGDQNRLLHQADRIHIDEANYAFGEVMLGEAGTQGACYGDSGGPAYAIDASGAHLWGIASRILNETDPVSCTQNSVYTRIDAYWDWIAERL